MSNFKFISVLVLAFVILFQFSCRKRLTQSGIVYSRNHIPISGVLVSCDYSIGGQSEIVGHVSTTTDKNGNFNFAGTKIPNNSSIEHIRIHHSDSGSNFYLKGDIAFQKGMVLQLK